LAYFNGKLYKAQTNTPLETERILSNTNGLGSKSPIKKAKCNGANGAIVFKSIKKEKEAS
jgi:hypothetical protein